MDDKVKELTCTDCIWCTEHKGKCSCDKNVIDIVDPDVDYCDEHFVWNE